MAEQVLAGKVCAAKHQPPCGPLYGNYPCHLPEGWMALSILQVLAGWLRCILEKKESP